MKTNTISLLLCLLAFSSIGFAQSGKAPARSAGIAAEKIVKDLYAAHKNEKTSPFTQIRSRTLVDKYFSYDFAEMIWKTNSSETGWNVDPLYNSQDPQITAFMVGKAREDGHDGVYLKVTFKSYGKPDWVGFSVTRRTDMVWKIDNIDYSDGEDLQGILRYSTDLEYQKLIDGDLFKGSYLVGAKLCDVMPTMNGMFHRVTCDGQDGFRIYATEGDENQTSYIRNDGKVKTIDQFVFKKDEQDGKFIDALGREAKVTKVKTPNEAMPISDSGSEPVSGELQVGKTESVILYVGMETGDYAAYCFTNNSDEGRALLAACKDKDQCEIKATLGDDGGSCKVPGLEATLSAKFKITKVASAKSLGRRK